MIQKIDIMELSYKEMEEFITKEGFPSYRTRQIYHWLYQKKINNFKQMKNIPLDLITTLESLFQLKIMDSIRTIRSEDGTIKFLFRLEDGQLIESVLIRNKNRNTACLSSQVGCMWRCLFCASGREGFKRNLQVGEIVGQLLAMEIISGEHINNIVFMGMGEPFDNYQQLIKAIIIINEKWGINIGARKITISTCGIIPGIEKLSENQLQVELSVSLHAVEDKVRTFLMPVNKKYPLKKLISACRKYVRKKNRTITFEYLLLKGINDSPKQAKKLSYLISDFKSKVNLIVYNPISNQSNLSSSEEETILSFQQILKNNHIPVTIRYSKGRDVEAACGQLKVSYLNIL